MKKQTPDERLKTLKRLEAFTDIILAIIVFGAVGSIVYLLMRWS